jgi:hypothetical protein
MLRPYNRNHPLVTGLPFLLGYFVGSFFGGRFFKVKNCDNFCPLPGRIGAGRLNAGGVRGWRMGRCGFSSLDKLKVRLFIRKPALFRGWQCSGTLHNLKVKAIDNMEAMFRLLVITLRSPGVPFAQSFISPGYILLV